MSNNPTPARRADQAAKRLTDLAIRNAKPPHKWEEDGLIVDVTSAGKRFGTRYTFNGRRTLAKLGYYPDMSLADAKAAKLELHRKVRAGIDPQAEQPGRAERIERATTGSFEAMTRAWHEQMSTRRDNPWSPIYAKQMIQRLEVHAFPAIGTRPIGEVTRSEIIALLEACARKSGAFQADHVRNHLRTAFNEWLDHELIDRNPADRLQARTETPVSKGQPAVREIEAARNVITEVERLDRIDSLGRVRRGSARLLLMHRLGALVGLRPTEVREAEWTEFDTAAGAWNIPAKRMKGRRGKQVEHTVFLSPQALEVLEVARALTPLNCPFVFPSELRRRGFQPLDRSTLCEHLKRCLGKRVHVAHGWRSTLTTVMRKRHEGDFTLLQVMLAHQTKGKVARLYDRTTIEDFEPRARELWREWADLLLEGAPSPWTFAGIQPVSGSNVVQLANVRRAA